MNDLFMEGDVVTDSEGSVFIYREDIYDDCNPCQKCEIRYDIHDNCPLRGRCAVVGGWFEMVSVEAVDLNLTVI